MKKNLPFLVIALCGLILPLVIRTLWFYGGVPERRIVETPDYASIKVPSLSTSTPRALEFSPAMSKVVVLFDMTHTNWFTPAEIEPFIHMLQRAGADIRWSSYETDLSVELNKASTYIVINPNTAFYDSELSDISTFVKQGGKLIVITDPTRNEYYYSDYYSTSLLSVDVANQLLSPYGISFYDDYAYNLLENEGNFRNIFVYPSSNSGLVSNVHRLVLYSAHTLSTDGESLFNSSNDTVSSLTDAGGNLVFATLDDQFEVLAIGDYSFLTSSGHSSADNQEFLFNITSYATSSEKYFTAEQFPYMLTGDLDIYVTDGLEKDYFLLTSISNLLHSDLISSKSVRFTDSLEKTRDTIVLGLIPPAGDIAELVSPFEIEFFAEEYYSEPLQETTIVEAESLEATPIPYEEEWSIFPEWNEQSDTVILPGFGEIPQNGIGLILYTRIEGGNIFILLGNSQSEVIQLLDNMTYQTFSSCITNKGITVCPVYDASY